MARRRRRQPKRIVYLWGAGATHAEAQRLGSTVSLLMRDSPTQEGITTRILRRTGKRALASYGGESAGNVDIEKLISLLVASGSQTHAELADKLRENYFLELRASLHNVGLFGQPELASRLLTMHASPRFKSEAEILKGIITTNHDGLLQLASQRVFGGINLGFEFKSRDYSFSAGAATILQLHGSFTWQFSTPTTVSRFSRTSSYEGTLWIPPTILKESKSFPYNKLSALAYELMVRECDVLRVIGTSLTQNDWNILSLIFNAQRHIELNGGEPFLIELIMPHDAGERIKSDCAYLKNVFAIGFLTDGNFSEYKTSELIPADSDLMNPFAYWLSEKLTFHRNELRDQPNVPNVAAQIGALA
jgi:hypothetical protein